MKNYKVIATRFFRDSNEIDKKTGLKVERKVYDELSNLAQYNELYLTKEILYYGIWILTTKE